MRNCQSVPITPHLTWDPVWHLPIVWCGKRLSVILPPSCGQTCDREPKQKPSLVTGTPYVAFVIPLTDGRIVLTLLTSDIKNYYKLKTFYCRELQIFSSWKCRVESRDNSNYVIQRKGEEFLSEIYRQPHHWVSGRDKEIIKTDFTSTIKRNV